MIKRALGLRLGTGAATKGDDSDSDSEEGRKEGLLPDQRRKLERRLLPGGEKPSKAIKKPAIVEEQEDDDEEDEEDEENEDDGEDSDGDSQLSEIPMPPEADPDGESMRGKFKCQLCPHKVLLTEKAMELHLQSTQHKRNEKRFEHAKELGLDAYQAECRARAEAKAKVAEESALGLTKRKQKNFEYWKKKREKQMAMKKRKKVDEKTKASVDAAEVEKAKLKFQAKKARRQERKEAGQPAEMSANKFREVALAASPQERKPNRKERRAALFGNSGTAPDDKSKTPVEAADGADAETKTKKTKKRRAQ